MNKEIINEALNKRLKSKDHQKRLTEYLDTVVYSKRDLEELCSKLNYNLVITDDYVAVYPIDEAEIVDDVSYLKEYIKTFCADEHSINLERCIDYIYKEMKFLKGIIE